MSKAYAICCELNNPKRDYSELYDAIQNCGRLWWHYLDSVWLVISDATPNQIWSQLDPHRDKSDYFLIIEIRENVQGWLPKDAWDWIHEHVPS